MSDKKTDDAYARERWAYILKTHSIFADGHRLVTHGSHTGHMYQTVALCENAIIAEAVAKALEAYKDGND